MEEFVSHVRAHSRGRLGQPVAVEDSDVRTKDFDGSKREVGWDRSTAEREAPDRGQIELSQFGIVEHLPGHRRHSAETGGSFPLGETQQLGHVPLPHQHKL